ncbi:MAG TPA: DUF397 domain-containing protein [Streptosporangiaceae bacterium]
MRSFEEVETVNGKLTGAAWRKSSYSGNTGGNCVEVAAVASHEVGSTCVCTVRDSKYPDGLMLAFSIQEWRKFATNVKAGLFNRT